MRIAVDVEIEKSGKKVIASGMVDTGAEVYAFVDRGLASKLSLTTGERMAFAGVGGETKYGFVAPVDRLGVAGNKDCQLKNVSVLVGDKGNFAEVDILLGEHFLRSLNAELFMTPDGATLRCSGSREASALSIVTGREKILGAVILGLAGLLVVSLVTSR